MERKSRRSYPECDPEVFTDFVNYSYRGKLGISTSSVCRLIELLDFLDASQTLVDHCIEWATLHLDLSTVCEYLVFAKRLRHRAETLYHACMQWIEENAIDAMEHGVFNELPLEELVTLAQSRHLCANEIQLFEALRGRQRTTSEGNPSGIPFQHVQLGVMTLEQLSGTVKESGVYDERILSDLTFSRVLGEFRCDPEKLRNHRQLPWRWKGAGITSSLGNTKNWLHMRRHVNTPFDFTAFRRIDHVHCNKNGYRVAVFNTTPTLHMTVTFLVPVRVKTTVRPESSSESSPSYTRPIHQQGPAYRIEETTRKVSIKVFQQDISLCGRTMGCAQFKWSVKQDFLLDIHHRISRDGLSAFHIQLNGIHSTEIVAPSETPIRWKLRACDPGLKLCVLPKWE